MTSIDGTKYILKDYFCCLMLDPDEWPGDWEALLNNYSKLEKREYIDCSNHEAIQMVPLEKSEEVYVQFLKFLSDVLSEGKENPNGGLCFVESNTNKVLRTNWELNESTEWKDIASKLETSDSFTHVFGSTNADVEFSIKNDEVSVQHVDYEFPGGIDKSRSKLPGAIFSDVNKFINSIKICVEFLDKLKALAEKEDKLSAFDSFF